MRAAFLVSLLAACGFQQPPQHQQPDSGTAADAVGTRRCDLTKPFGSLGPVAGVNTADADESPSLMPDELTMYFASNRQSPGTADCDLYVATRANRDDAFSMPVHLTALSTGSDDRSPSISADGLSLFLHSSRSGSYEIYVATRPSTAASFGQPTPLGSDVNDTTVINEDPAIAATGHELYFIHVTSVAAILRATLGANGFGSSIPVAELNPDAWAPVVSADDLTIYFASGRTGTVGRSDTWVATRTSADAMFGNISDVAELNLAGADSIPGWVSPDGCRMYFSTERPGGAGDFDIWQATRPR